MEQRYAEYIRDIKLQIIKEESRSYETPPYTFKKLALLEKMEYGGLKGSALEYLRPGSLEEIIGQELAMRALMAKLNTPPFPPSILFCTDRQGGGGENQLCTPGFTNGSEQR